MEVVCMVAVYTIYCISCGFVGLDNKLYKMHGTYIKIGIVLFGKFFTTKNNVDDDNNNDDCCCNYCCQCHGGHYCYYCV